RILPRYPLWLGILVTAAGGMVVIYAIAIPVLAHNGHLSLWAATASNGWYLIGDSVKVVVTALVAKRVHRAYPGLIVGRRPRLASSRTLTPARSHENEGTAPLA
ncbi:MAG: biotin transporter BioY, partial [Actinomycetota bacterium]|nr:biotin transporter BioY [Actinomycetota bacterium]